MAGVPPYVEAGVGQPLVFLHGWTMDGTIFANQADRLAGEFRCVAPDLPGHGANRTDGLTIGDAAAELRALLEAEDLRDVILIGWSLGALVAWTHLQACGGDRVRGLISVDMSPKPANEAGWSLGLRGLDPEACQATTGRFRKHWTASVPAIARGMFAGRDGPRSLLLASTIERIAANDRTAMIAMWESLLAADLRGSVARLPVPMLVAHGRLSRVYGAETAHWLHDSAPHSARREFTMSGHSPHLEEPDAFADAVRDFDASLPAL